MLTYIVKEGETLWQISKKLQVTLDSLVYMNPQIYDPNYILPGSEIYIPEKTKEPAPLKTADKQKPEPLPEPPAARHRRPEQNTVSLSQKGPLPQADSPPAARNRRPEQNTVSASQKIPLTQSDGPPFIYQARPGETLAIIAQRLNIDPKRLIKLNLHLSPQIPLKETDTVFVPEKVPVKGNQVNQNHSPGHPPRSRSPFPDRRRNTFPGNSKGRASNPPQPDNTCPYCGHRLPPG